MLIEKELRVMCGQLVKDVDETKNTVGLETFKYLEFTIFLKIFQLLRVKEDQLNNNKSKVRHQLQNVF